MGFCSFSSFHLLRLPYAHTGYEVSFNISCSGKWTHHLLCFKCSIIYGTDFVQMRLWRRCSYDVDSWKSLKCEQSKYSVNPDLSQYFVHWDKKCRISKGKMSQCASLTFTLKRLCFWIIAVCAEEIGLKITQYVP